MPLEQVLGVLKSHQCNKKPGEITVSVFLWTLRLTASLLKSFRHRLHCYTLPIHIRPSLYFHKMHYLPTRMHISPLMFVDIPIFICIYFHIRTHRLGSFSLLSVGEKDHCSKLPIQPESKWVWQPASGNYTCNIMSFNFKRHNNTYKILKQHNNVFKNCMTFLCHKYWKLCRLISYST